MRPSAFQRRSVFRCASRSTRLCTCMSSTRLCLSSVMERCICSMPFRSAAAPDPGVHTLVAMKVCPCCSAVSRSPNTASAVEYIGEVSMSVAPAAKNACSASRNGARAASSAPTSNGPEVPRPIAGSISSLDGMRRFSIWLVAAALLIGRRAPSSPAGAPWLAATAARLPSARKFLRSIFAPPVR